MSRVGNKPILIPQGINVTFQESLIKIKSETNYLDQFVDNSCLSILIDNSTINIKRLNEKKSTKAYHGLIRVLIQNMILGVTENFSKLLIAEGVGYKFQIEKNTLILYMGFSHKITLLIPTTLKVKLEAPTKLLISGINKEIVGLFAAKIRDIKPPEPYKGKGIRYENEIIKRKAGKTRK
jgi:large subunit ribosomal protein L6